MKTYVTSFGRLTQTVGSVVLRCFRKGQLGFSGKPQEMQQEPRSLVKTGLAPPQCAFVSLPLLLASAPGLLFLPPGSPLKARAVPHPRARATCKSLPLLLPIDRTGAAFWAHLEAQIKSRASPPAGTSFVLSLIKRNLAGV